MRIETFEAPLSYEAAGIARPLTPNKVTVYAQDAVDLPAGYTTPVVVLCPGGGYTFVSPREGEPVALAFSAAGFQVVELTYSIAPDRYPTALFQLAATVRWVRENAEKYRFDVKKVVVCGFSAGGHLAASLCVYWNKEFLARGLSCESEALRPDGGVICYAVISGDPAIYHGGSIRNLYGEKYSEAQRAEFSLDKNVGPQCPPAFLWHTFSDAAVPVENSLRFADALATHKVPFEMHVYPNGKHGLSLATPQTGDAISDDQTSLRGWPGLAAEWIRRL